MGYWNQGADGTSLHTEETGLIWGDDPADTVDNALQAIYDAFKRDLGRPPTVAEIRAGFEFAMGGMTDQDIVERLGEPEDRKEGW